ncbi:MAG TPA: GNAT family N-acetyltransferase [Phycisphaerae bacterium]|nr:GNAT family N-acetyltransferase [Phycisphaerae bacterium]
MISIVAGHAEPQLLQTKVLFLEYIAALGFHLTFQDVDQEMAELPGRYAPPEGRILIAELDGEVAGCVAMKKLREDVCEMKRFYVRPGLRGHGIGRKLAEAIVAEARSAGYRRMCLDTVPSMQAAMALYESLGFKDGEPYVINPVPGARFMELVL